MTENEKQEQKAKENVAAKGADSQSEKDRIDESVGEQEKKDGNEDSQSAKDRVDESEGTKEYDEKKAEEKREQAHDDLSEKIMARIDSKIEEAVTKAVAEAMAKALDNAGRKAEQAEPSEAKELESIYGE